MRRIDTLLLLLAACGSDVAQQTEQPHVQIVIQGANAQPVNPTGMSRMTVLDGGLCAGTGSSGDPFHCDLTTDSTLNGTGSAGSPLAASNALASFGFAAFGDGSDGALHWDGSSTITLRDGSTVAPSSSVYTVNTDIFADGSTIDSGVTVVMAGFRYHDKGTLTLSGKIARNGNNGSGATGGAALAAAFLGGSGAGGSGGAGGGGAATAGGAAGAAVGTTGVACANTGGAAGNPGGTGGACHGGGGGTGGDGAAQAGGAVSLTTAAATNFRTYVDSSAGRSSHVGSTAFTGGSGGGGGRGASTPTTAGGGGGSGGGYVVVIARKISGSGSIEAKGGNGADGTTGNNTGGGGGGGGGTVACIVGTGGCPTITVSGGTHGAGKGTGANGGDGGTGTSISIQLGP